MRVQEAGSHIEVHIQFEGERFRGLASPPAVLWGVYRGSSRRWQHPESAVPAGSAYDEASGAMRTPAAGDGSLTLRFPRRLAPATLAWVGVAGGEPVTPLAGRQFALPLGMGPGSPDVLGPAPTPDGTGVNFALACASAAGVSLLVFRRGAGADGGPWVKALELELDPGVHRTGAVWHVALPGLAAKKESMAYAWRVDGDIAWDGGNRTQPGVGTAGGGWGDTRQHDGHSSGGDNVQSCSGRARCRGRSAPLPPPFPPSSHDADRLLLDPRAPALELSHTPPENLGPLKPPCVQLEEQGKPVFLLSSLAVLGSDVAAGRPEPAGGTIPAPAHRIALHVDVRAAGVAILGGF